MKTAIVVGSGAGGATVAKELQGRFDVTVLEAGGEFRPFPLDLKFVERVKKLGLMLDERQIGLLFPSMKVRKSGGMVMVNGVGLGGTTTLATGNGIRFDHDLKAIGLDLDAEFEELYREVPISTDHQKRWKPATRRLFSICQDMGLEPAPLPKMGYPENCVHCGRCVLGCAYGAKWDSRQFLRAAESKGAKVICDSRVTRVVVDGSRAIGVKVKRGLRTEFLPADLVVLAAGGFGSPSILKRSGIPCEDRLFVDPVLCVAVKHQDARQNKELSMPFVVQKEGYILAPYFDHLSYFFNNDWTIPARDTLGMMIKLADASIGSVANGTISKSLTPEDRQRLADGVDVCCEIFGRKGVQRRDTWLGTINAGHPGGMLPLTSESASSMHPAALPENLYVADATLFPRSLGNPPILTIMAMAKRISRLCAMSSS